MLKLNRRLWSSKTENSKIKKKKNQILEKRPFPSMDHPKMLWGSWKAAGNAEISNVSFCNSEHYLPLLILRDIILKANLGP